MKALRQQQIQRSPQHLVGAIPKESLSLRVDRADQASIVSNHDGVGHRLDELA
jgi:hypothetical protein